MPECVSIGETKLEDDATLVITHLLYHMDVIRMSDGLIADSNMPSKNLQAASEAYELHAAVQATTVPQRHTMVPRYFATGNLCIMKA